MFVARKREACVKRNGIRFSVLILVLLSTIGVVACQPVAPPHPRTDRIVLKAHAGEDFAIQVGESPTFDGCNSVGNITNYKWWITEAPENMAEYDGKVIREVDPNCSFTLTTSMLADDVGMWEIELMVSDAKNRISRDSVQVDVVP
jgi:hypothetical protein